MHGVFRVGRIYGSVPGKWPDAFYHTPSSPLLLKILEMNKIYFVIVLPFLPNKLFPSVLLLFLPSSPSFLLFFPQLR